MNHLALRHSSTRVLRRVAIAGAVGALALSVAPATSSVAAPLDGDEVEHSAGASEAAVAASRDARDDVAVDSEAADTADTADDAAVDVETRDAAAALPASCRASVTVIRPDRSLTVGILQGSRAELYPSGTYVDFEPRAAAFLGTSSNRGVTVDRFAAIDTGGVLHHLTVTARTSAGQKRSVTLADTELARHWGGIRSIVGGGPYVYGLTTTGGLKRYVISGPGGVKAAGTVASRGWGSVKSLGYGGWWNLPGNKVSDDLIGISTTGRLTAYSVPRDAPTKVSSRLLGAKGWNAYTHVATGECVGSQARPILGIRADGSVTAFLDANGNDQSGSDIRGLGRVATGWTGVVAD